MGSLRIIKPLEAHELEPFSHIDRYVFREAAHVAVSVSESPVELNSERFLRTFHPDLACCRHVMVFTSDSTCVWVVLERGGIRGLKIGGRPVQLRPTSQYEPRLPRQGFLYPSVGFPPSATEIQTTRFLPPNAIRELREVFPMAVGLRVYKSGYASLLGPEDTFGRKGIRGITLSRPAEIGGLRMLIECLRIRPIPLSCPSRRQSTTEAVVDTRDFPGLKIRLEDGTDVVTTSTHGISSQLECTSSLSQAAASFLQWSTDKLLQILPSAMRVSTNMLGQQDAFGESGHHINGVISKTYDSPSGTFPYPYGYQHDLSLIAPLSESSSSNVGALTPGSHTESSLLKLEGFANAETVLSDRATGKLLAIQPPRHRNSASALSPLGCPQTRSPEPANSFPVSQVVEAAQYIWEQNVSRSALKENKYSISLLWRSHPLHILSSTPPSRSSDPDPNQFEGPEILCIRKPEAHPESDRGSEKVDKAKVVVFQNFECTVETLVPVDSSDKEEDDIQVQLEGDTYRLEPMTLKGGFVLPEEIVAAEILGFAS
ncbi:hypothetical protein BDN72DRAFT_956776 [Pluteus cervinus]|uniref:Uncharacterized protein n=1 Tax=Pluteus cervinus TaxID=181527 RepID=A0ACD3B5B0_9AGAR|nr:hypothetical protein BDN72DRAFT_956776 [Pluteus cervinus]